MPENYLIRFLQNEIPQIYIDALSLTEHSAPKLKPYVFATEAIAAAMADELREQCFTVEPRDSRSFSTDAQPPEVQFCSLLCGRVA